MYGDLLNTPGIQHGPLTANRIVEQKRKEVGGKQKFCS